MSTKKLNLMVLICSTRPGALGPQVAQWFIRTATPLARQLGAELEPVSVTDLALPFLDEAEHPATGLYEQAHTREWSAMVEHADGFIVVTPEYNYGMPAALKNALDYLSGEWAWKPVGFICYGHTSAGTRSVQHARQVTTTLRMVSASALTALRISEVFRYGCIQTNPKLESSNKKVLREVVRLAHALRPMREAESAPTGPVPGSYVRPLAADDAHDVVILQRCCWVDEALANQTLDIAALHENEDAVRAWLREWTVVGLWRDGRLLGMARGIRDGLDWRIGRLAVTPDLRGKGVGRWLLRHIEQAKPAACERQILSTGSRSLHNINLYESEGYRQEQDASGVVTLVKPAAC